MSTCILAFDTATEACSVALIIDRQISERFIVAPREHSIHILPMVDSLLKEAGIILSNIDVISFGSGPGSFTGVRIGIGIAQGLAFGADLPLLGISTLATLAQGAKRETGANRVLSAINARKGAVYWAPYCFKKDSGWLASSECSVIKLDNTEVIIRSVSDGEWTYAGTGWQFYPSIISNSHIYLRSGKTLFPKAQDMIPIALQLLKSGKAMEANQVVEPAYMHNEVVWNN